MSEHCGTTTEEGNAGCVPGTCSCSSESKNDQPILVSIQGTEIETQQGEDHVEENS